MSLSAVCPAEADVREAASGSILPLALAGVGYAVGRRQLIDDISVTLAPGSRTVVLGPNGAGKSLLLRLCHGLLRPSAGTISWSDTDPERIRRGQAMVFQQPVLLRRSTAANVDYALAVRGTPRRERRALVAQALANAGLSELAGQPARLLSGGEQQRLALARAWALCPQVLFLDEPTASLDPAATRVVEDMIAAIHAAGAKIVMSTHDLGQARRVADEVLFLHRGRLAERSAAGAFFSGPQCEEAAAFLEGRLAW